MTSLKNKQDNNQGQNWCMSKYNIYYREKSGFYIFNAFTGAFATVRDEYRSIFNDMIQKSSVPIDLQKIPLALFNDLKNGGYIVPLGFDETEYLKTLNMIWRFGHPSLILTICPTLCCNFNCSYCYENTQRPKGIMENTIANAILEFIEKECSQHIKRLYIVWYGGEPLLEIHRIESMMTEINSICNNSHVKLSTTLVTNGYLLNKSIRSILKKSGITKMQVTIDGPPVIHDKRRRLLNGDGTFQTIFKNVIDALEEDFSISIRINIDEENISSLPSLFEIFTKEEVIHKKALIYTAQTIHVSGGCSDFPDDYLLQDATYAKERYLLQSKLISLGFKTGITPTPKANSCLAIGNGAYVIDPFGHLYKCWMDAGVPEYAVGRLEGSGEVNFDKVKILQWLSYNPFNEKCSNCKILPLCVGGCYYYPVRLGKKRCSELKYGLKNYLFLSTTQIARVSKV